MSEIKAWEIDYLMKHYGNCDKTYKAFRRAPKCHFKTMHLVYGETPSGCGMPDRWWECSVCGHTKEVKK